MMISIDSLPGITDAPDYYKDYKKFVNRRVANRGVTFGNIIWNESGSNALLDIRSQDNKDRWIVSLNAENGKIKTIDRQRDEAWIDGPGISGFRAKEGWLNDNTVYFQSEATGYSQLYSFNINTSSKTSITQGKYEVQDVVLSKSKQNFYLLTNEEHPGKQNWYKIKIDGTGKEKITSATGGYEVSLSPDEKTIAYRYSYINKPWELFIQENAANKKSTQITNKAVSEEFKQYAWRENKIFTITARDGQSIYARLYEPKKGTKNNAAVIFVHGAGYLQNVHYWWSNNYPREYMFNNLLADKGYTVIDIDYRGSAGYGRDWRTGIYRFMGGKDLDDEVDAAKYLVKELGIDSTRIGMYGGSYGGFMTLMAMFTAPDVIKAGAALRPVTDWAHYNHGYTANILNEPFNDSIAYAKSSPINFANGLKNHLLICHGMVDQNVNFQDAVRLNQRLIELGKDNWSMAVYPVEDHGFVEPSSWTDEYKRILQLFDTWLVK
jgi:dipeptidyl aminopeptidase/acylaminoacyl peptidase